MVKRVQFWTDPWCSRVALYMLFSVFYSLAKGKSDSVKDCMIRSRAFCSSNVRLRRYLNDWETEDMGKLLEMLENYSLGDRDMEDERVWVLDESNGFSVNSSPVHMEFYCPVNDILLPLVVVVGQSSNVGQSHI